VLFNFAGRCTASFEIGLNSKTTGEQFEIRSAEPYLAAEVQRRSTGFPRIGLPPRPTRSLRHSSAICEPEETS
jgi:hypothetical protein